jgi:hypothetical protein
MSAQGALIDHNVGIAYLALWRLDEAERFLESTRKGGMLVGNLAVLALPIFQGVRCFLSALRLPTTIPTGVECREASWAEILSG